MNDSTIDKVLDAIAKQVKIRIAQLEQSLMIYRAQAERADPEYDPAFTAECNAALAKARAQLARLDAQKSK